MTSIYVVSHDYSPSEDTIYLPQYLLNNCFISHNDEVNVTKEILQKVTKIVLKPVTNNFAKETLTPKKILEKEIVQKYPILSLNDTININGHDLLVQKIEPEVIVSTINSDPIVEFLQSFEEEQKEKEQEEKLQRELEDKLHINFPGKGQSISGNVTREYASLEKKKETEKKPKTTNLAGKSRLV